MKKRRDRLYGAEAALLLTMCAVLLSGVWAQGRQRGLAEKVVRLHVLAASDSETDQSLKLTVRDAVLAWLEPRLAKAANAAEARAILEGELPELELLAERVSGQTARAVLGREHYPTREYGSFSLPAGEYTSLRIALGEGKGRNWWCVVYPPLCGADPGEIRETAALDGEDVHLITEDGTDYEIRFRILEWWGEVMEKWGGKQADPERAVEAPAPTTRPRLVA